MDFLEYIAFRFAVFSFTHIKQTPMADLEKANEYKALGNEAFKNKKYEDAINYFTKAIECNPSDHVFYSNRSGSYLNNGNYQKALEDAQACVKLNSGWARGYQRKGTALFYLNRINEAIEAYNQGLKIEPDNQQLQNDLKSAEAKQGVSQQAMLQAYMKLASNPETKDFLSDPQFMQKVQTLIQNPAAFALFANDPKIMKAYQVISSGPSNFNFEDFMKNMEKQEASSGAKPEKMEEEVSTPPPQSKPEPKKEQASPKQVDPAENLKNEGNNEYKKKNFQKALELYQQAIDIKPDEPLYYNNKAAAYIQINEYENAHKELDKAEKIFADGLKDFSKRAKVLARRASLLAKEGKYEESITEYEKSLLEDGAQKVRDQLRAVKKLKKQKDDKAYLNPELAEKACEAGNAHFKQGKYPAAIQEYEEAIKRNPEVAKYYSNLGTAFIKLMEWPRAVQSFEKALQKDSNFIKAYTKKGDCHYAMKEFHKALEAYEAGLKIDPNNDLCKQGLAKTQQAIYMAGSSQTEEQKVARAKRAMTDPQIKQILQTPEVMNALNDLQNNPAAIQNIMKNPSLAAKIEKLIQAGVIGTG